MGRAGAKRQTSLQPPCQRKTKGNTVYGPPKLGVTTAMFYPTVRKIALHQAQMGRTLASQGHYLRPY